MNKTCTIPVASLPTAHKHAYNPSILDVHGMGMITYRWHPKDASWRTEIALEYDGRTKPVLPPVEYAKYSHEDGRLFMLNGKAHLSLTLSRSRMNGQSRNPSVTGYGELVQETDCWKLVNWIEPQYGDNNWTGVCKNLVFFEA